MLTQQDNDFLTQVGHGTPMGELWRRFWLPALLPAELPDPDCPPVRHQLLGENLVLFRDTTGRVGAIADSCPHRGASLFFGRNEEDGLRCVYHGWKFDTSGTCVDMPNEPAESNFKHKIRATAYPARDWGGLIWVYMGPPQLEPALPQIELCLVPDSHRYIGKALHENNFAQGIEGDIDSAHVSFLHRTFDPSAEANQARRGTEFYEDLAPRLTFKETDYGFVYGARRTRTDGSYYWRVTQTLLPTWTLIPGPTWPCSGHAYIPMDDHHTWVFGYTFNPKQPLDPQHVENFKRGGGLAAQVHPGTFKPVLNKENDYGIDRDVQRTRTYTGIFGGNAQDRAIVESMGYVLDRTVEHLGTSDIAVITFRRILMKLAQQLQKGVEPYAATHGDVYRVRRLDVVDPEAEFGMLLGKHAEVMHVPSASPA